MVQVKDVVIYRKNDVMSNIATIYTGSLNDLSPFDDSRLQWHHDDGKDLYYLTLGEIAEQLKAQGFAGIVTVVTRTAKDGNVYEMGNHGAFKWERIGTLMTGYNILLQGNLRLL